MCVLDVSVAVSILDFCYVSAAVPRITRRHGMMELTEGQGSLCRNDVIWGAA